MNISLQERKAQLEGILKNEFNFFFTHIKNLREFWDHLRGHLEQFDLAEEYQTLIDIVSNLKEDEDYNAKTNQLKYIFKILLEATDWPDQFLLESLEFSGNFAVIEFIKCKLDEQRSKCKEKLPEILFGDEIDFVKSRAHSSEHSCGSSGAGSPVSPLGFDQVDSIFDKKIFSLFLPSFSTPEPEIKHPLADATVPQLIEDTGYPCETHKITTSDGYILTCHRIPFGKYMPLTFGGDKKVIWLQHGLLSSSADWIMNEEDKALAYKLADEGNDVWIGNARGNLYSRTHSHLNPSGKEFWDFSIHEKGVFDVPAVIYYVLGVTNVEKLTWIGHSMGCAMFFIAMSTYPELNDKIQHMVALAPVTYLNNMISPLRILSPISNKLEMALDFLGAHEFLPNAATRGLLARIIPYESKNHYVLHNLMFILCGFDAQQMNEKFLPLIMSHAPAGASTKTLIHLSQLVNAKSFQSFDHGPQKNLKKYGTESPIQYDLKKVTCPVTIIYAHNDWLTVPRDVCRLARELPNLKGSYKVDLDCFTHLDFLWAVDADKYVYNRLLDIIKSY